MFVATSLTSSGPCYRAAGTLFAYNLIQNIWTVMTGTGCLVRLLDHF